MRRSLLPSRGAATSPPLKEYTPDPPFWTLPTSTWARPLSGEEMSEHSFLAYVDGALKKNGIVFTCIMVRQLIFSEARFQFQRIQNGRPGDLFGTPELSLLESPWPNGTTGELLSRMEQDASLAGNFFAVRRGNRLRRLQPDRVTILAGSHSSPDDDPHGLDAEILAYLYHRSPAAEPDVLTPEEVVHYAPIPDPSTQFRGMSWITPVTSETLTDTAATTHKYRFFENGAVPSTVLVYDKSVDPIRLGEFATAFRESHAGTDNAYKTLHLAGGVADVKQVGLDMKTLDLKGVQGSIETRIAAASGVGSIIAQFSEGMAGSSLNAGNYAAARRRVADMTIRPLWRSAASSLASVLDVPAGARLWYDDRDIPFIAEDRKDAAEIESKKAATIRQLVEAGFTPESVVAAVESEDLRLLVHSGRLSVQLQDPSTATEEAAA